MTLSSLVATFGADEGKCRHYLELLRWPTGVVCPRCAGESVSRIDARNQHDCNSCRYQFSVKAGTVLNDSHLPLWKWFLAVYLMCESKEVVSANQLKRTLGVSYKTAWYLCHRIRSAMGDDENGKMLTGTVEVDETYIGGYEKNETIVLGAIERVGDVRSRRDQYATREVLWDFIEEHVANDTPHIYADELPDYGDLSTKARTHEAVNRHDEESVPVDVDTNSIEGVWSLLERSIVGSYYRLSAKHLALYLDELQFKFNNRENPYLFRDTLRRLLGGETLTYEKLTQDPASSVSS